MISAGLKRTIPSLSTEQSGFSFHLMWISPSSSGLASRSLRRSCCSTSRRNRSFYGVSSLFIQYPQIHSALFKRKKRQSLHGHLHAKTLFLFRFLPRRLFRLLLLFSLQFWLLLPFQFLLRFLLDRKQILDLLLNAAKQLFFLK